MMLVVLSLVYCLLVEFNRPKEAYYTRRFTQGKNQKHSINKMREGFPKNCITVSHAFLHVHVYMQHSIVNARTPICNFSLCAVQTYMHNISTG